VVLRSIRYVAIVFEISMSACVLRYLVEELGDCGFESLYRVRAINACVAKHGA
jgi:hypothetical protein